MLLSTLRALDALAELGDAENAWDTTGDTVPSSTRPNDDARALVQQAHAEYFRVLARIEAVRKKIDRADSKMRRVENGPYSDTRDVEMARYQQAIDGYLMEIEGMRPELAAAIERWKKLKARCGLRSKQPRATLMSSHSPRDVTETAEEYERASYQQMMAELERRRAAMVAKQARIAAERRGMVPLQDALAEQNVILQRLKATPREQQDNAEIFQCTTEIFSLLAQIQAYQRRIDDILDEP